MDAVVSHLFKIDLGIFIHAYRKKIMKVKSIQFILVLIFINHVPITAY